MIRLGLSAEEKRAAVSRYCAQNGIQRVFALAPSKFRTEFPAVDAAHVEWAEIILYVHYYRLLQEIDKKTLVIVDECLRLQNRHDLTYNCIRNFLNQTPHQIVFQALPLIDTIDDFMVLFDLDTRSRWKRERFQTSLLREADIGGAALSPAFDWQNIATDTATRTTYAAEKRKLIANIGLKDPHTIPRNLYLIGGKWKAAHAVPGHRYLARNSRLSVPVATYRAPSYPDAPYDVMELPHNFIDFADVVALSRQTRFSVMRADLKVDAWYTARFDAWAERVKDAQAVLLG